MIAAYERYRWICQSFVYPQPQEEKSFEAMLCNLAIAHVRTVVHYTPKRILVTTWTQPPEIV